MQLSEKFYTLYTESVLVYTVSFRLHGTGNGSSTSTRLIIEISTIEGAKNFLLGWLSDPNKIFLWNRRWTLVFIPLIWPPILSKSNSFNEEQKESSLTMTPKALYMHVTEIYGWTQKSPKQPTDQTRFF